MVATALTSRSLACRSRSNARACSSYNWSISSLHTTQYTTCIACQTTLHSSPEGHQGHLNIFLSRSVSLCFSASHSSLTRDLTAVLSALSCSNCFSNCVLCALSTSFSSRNLQHASFVVKTVLQPKLDNENVEHKIPPQSLPLLSLLCCFLNHLQLFSDHYNKIAFN